MISKHARSLLFIRHGETDYNRRQVRCGGDIDIPLTAQGEAQARQAAKDLQDASRNTLLKAGEAIDAFFVSPLQRTRQTADILHQSLGLSCPMILHEGLIERRLGAWNGLTLAETQPLLDAKTPPPGGEAEDVFQGRIRNCLMDILRQPYHLPLLVGSKGVARMIGLLADGDMPRGPAGNAKIMRFEITL